MITKEPTQADLKTWQQIWIQYKDQLHPNRKSGMELLHYLQDKFVLTERFDEHARRVISDNVTMNSLCGKNSSWEKNNSESIFSGECRCRHLSLSARKSGCP